MLVVSASGDEAEWVLRKTLTQKVKVHLVFEVK